LNFAIDILDEHYGFSKEYGAPPTMQEQFSLSRRGFLQSAAITLMGVGAFAGNQHQAHAQVSTHQEEKELNQRLNVVIYLYDEMTALDAIGPYEVLRLVPGAQVRFVAKKAGLVKPDSGLQMLNAEYGIADVDTADILIIPGGNAAGPIKDEHVLQWIRSLHEKTRWTTSVCVGSLILGAAGLLKGLQATSHWNSIQDLKYFGAQPVNQRYVRQGKIITAAGVSAGIDMALSLVALEQGDEMAKAIQLMIEYDPRPPFDSGSCSKASPEMIEKAKKMLIDLYSPNK
jgi:transcriptional regulator GlxA family with amidase domain